jgi:adenine-specific DNA-methyltransferase
VSEQKCSFTDAFGEGRGTNGAPDATAEQVDTMSGDMAAELRAALHELAPSAFAEGKLDVDVLRGLLGESAEEQPERYRFSWAGQTQAVRLAATPTPATLRPQPDRSAGWEDAPNAFVEGDNLHVLKLLSKAYFAAAKLVYIDPPYNLGNDRIYRDDYADSLEDYLRVTGQTNGAGELTVANPDTGGRFHSAWLSMMYPRLTLARRLLRPDGVLVAAIDDTEVHHLRLLLDSVFGPENFLACIVWEGGRKNDATFVSVGHDYMLVYARDQSELKARDERWRVIKPGVQDTIDRVGHLLQEHGDDHETATKELRGFLKPLRSDVARLAAAAELIAQTYPEVASYFPELGRPVTEMPGQRYNQVDARGAYRLSDIGWPGGGGPTYDLLHPVTDKPVRVPSGGWRYDKDKMQRLIAEDRVDLKADETGVPEYKRYLHETEHEVLTSVFYRTRTKAVQELTTLMGADVFGNPKDPDVIGRLLSAATSGDDLVIDFFAGSGSTAEAVMRTNDSDGGQRRWLLVQLPEKTPAESNAQEAGLQTISQAGLARIAKATEAHGVPEALSGYRVFTLDRTALNLWKVPDEVSDPDSYIDAQTDLSSEGLEALDDLAAVWEVAIREGYPLTSKTTTTTASGYTVWRVSATATGLPGVPAESLFICLADSIQYDITQLVAEVQGRTLVVRESALDDSIAANMAMHCRLKTV